jgi:hypothetical protein
MLPFQTENGSPGNFLNCLPFAFHANGSFLFVRWFNEETSESYPFANGLNGLNGLAHERV